ncbi:MULTISPECIES: hypothetical protein [unclassified Rhizobium]|jgi:hypothetical protein|uniref:hypothetical protein n=1 Tax=unclassified Rhizobium TaxID=2613769 RepID=UPI003D2E9230
MRITWFLLLAVLIAIVLCIPLFERGFIVPPGPTGVSPQEAPLLPVPTQQP